MDTDTATTPDAIVSHMIFTPLLTDLYFSAFLLRTKITPTKAAATNSNKIHHGPIRAGCSVALIVTPRLWLCIGSRFAFGAVVDCGVTITLADGVALAVEGVAVLVGVGVDVADDTGTGADDGEVFALVGVGLLVGLALWVGLGVGLGLGGGFTTRTGSP